MSLGAMLVGLGSAATVSLVRAQIALAWAAQVVGTWVVEAAVDAVVEVVVPPPMTPAAVRMATTAPSSAAVLVSRPVRVVKNQAIRRRCGR
jgi:hypothetical protein